MEIDTINDPLPGSYCSYCKILLHAAASRRKNNELVSCSSLCFLLPGLSWPMKYYSLKYTDKMPHDWTGGYAKAWFIRIRPKYKDDRGLLEHEKTHVRQWFFTLGFLLNLIVCGQRCKHTGSSLIGLLRYWTGRSIWTCMQGLSQQSTD